MATAMEKDHICSFCGVEFSCRQSLWKHKRKKHPENADGEKRKASLKCGVCDHSFLTHYELFGHVKELHFSEISISNLEFESEEEFANWRKQQESDGLFLFVQKRQASTDSGSRNKRQYFYCHRSGDFKSKSAGKQAPTHNVTNRIGYQCTAFVFAKIDPSGRVEISYSLDHYKHDSSLSRFPLSDEIKAKIAGYLKQKRSFDWILDELRSEL